MGLKVVGGEGLGVDRCHALGLHKAGGALEASAAELAEKQRLNSRHYNNILESNSDKM
jgi:hypothetical protein